MRELAEQTGESVSIYVRNGDVRVCLHRIDSRHAVRGNVREGIFCRSSAARAGAFFSRSAVPKANPTTQSGPSTAMPRSVSGITESTGVSVPSSEPANSWGAHSCGTVFTYRRDIHSECSRVASAHCRAGDQLIGGRRIAHQSVPRGDLAGKPHSLRRTALHVPRSRLRV
jgi:hypothetical protein